MIGLNNYINLMMICNEIVHLDADNQVLLEVLDGRTVRMTFDAHPIETIQKKKKIVSINISGVPYIALDEYNKVFVTVNERLHTYVITEIDQIADNVFQLHTMPRTKSSFFATPVIASTRDVVKWGQFFVNTFIISEQSIVVLFRFFDTEGYRTFEHTMTKHPLFEKVIDTDVQHVAMQFKVPEEHINNIKLFLEGQYSRMSTPYKEHILKFHNFNKESKVGQILFKADNRRKQLELDLEVTLPADIELYDKPDEREMFKKKEDDLLYSRPALLTS